MGINIIIILCLLSSGVAQLVKPLSVKQVIAGSCPAPRAWQTCHISDIDR